MDFAARQSVMGDGGGVLPLEVTEISVVATRSGRDGKLLSAAEKFASGEDFWWFVASRLRRGSLTWLFAMQSMLLLDLSGFWDFLEENAIEITGHDHRSEAENGGGAEPAWQGYAVTADPPTVILLRHKRTGGTLKIVDVRNYGITSWADLGSPIDRPAGLNQFVAEVIGTLREFGLGSLQNTAGSQALYSYRHSYLTHEISIDGRDEIADFESRAYFGGRCEAKRIGRIEGPVYHLDVNSHYLSCAVDSLIPTDLVGVRDGVSVHELGDLCLGNLVIARVLIDTPRPDYPYRDEQLTIYPIGRYWTYLCSPELEHAVIRDRIIKVGRVQLYQGAMAFEKWCDELWSLRMLLRDRGQRWGEKFIKRVAVGLFGKFGQRSFRWVDRPEIEAGYPYRQWCTQSEKPNEYKLFRSLAWRTQELLHAGYCYDSFPAISAFVTSYGRVKLSKIIAQIGIENVYYYDTDSVWTNDVGAARAVDCGLVHDSELGKLKSVEMSDWLQINGVKNYETPTRRVLAGLSRRLVEYIGDAGIGWSVQRLSDSLKVRTAPTKIAVADRVETVPPYHHGIVDCDGFVHPIELPRREF